MRRTLVAASSFHSFWLVRGIGIVRMSNAHAGTTVVGNPVNVDGGEKEMTAYGIRSLAVNDPTHATKFDARVYPNPGNDAVNISLYRPASKIFLYGVGGQFVRTFELGGARQEALLWVNDLPNGAYFARIQYEDGSASAATIVVAH